jgi:hypothetical protein
LLATMNPARISPSTATLQLPLLSLNLALTFPLHPTPEYYPPSGPPPSRPCRPHDLFHLHLPSLWLLWELVLLNAPVLIQGDTPRASGEVVWCLLELISPLEYASEWRPYFTVQDPDFSKLRNGWCGGILGVTNPVFSKVGGDWGSNVVSVRRIQVPGTRVQTELGSGPRVQGDTAKAGATGRLAAFFRLGSGKGRSSESESTSKRPSAHAEVVQGVTSSYKPWVGKEKGVVRKVAEAAIRGEAGRSRRCYAFFLHWSDYPWRS